MMPPVTTRSSSLGGTVGWRACADCASSMAQAMVAITADDHAHVGISMLDPESTSTVKQVPHATVVLVHAGGNPARLPRITQMTKPKEINSAARISRIVIFSSRPSKGDHGFSRKTITENNAKVKGFEKFFKNVTIWK